MVRHALLDECDRRNAVRCDGCNWRHAVRLDECDRQNAVWQGRDAFATVVLTLDRYREISNAAVAGVLRLTDPRLLVEFERRGLRRWWMERDGIVAKLSARCWRC